MADSLGVCLIDILNIHDMSSSSSNLPFVLGDGFLYEQSKVFRSLRDWALRNGVEFARPEDDFNTSYFGFPLLFLNEIIGNRKVPLRDNVLGLRWLAEKYELKFEYPCPAPNVISHETCHILVNDYFGGESPTENGVGDVSTKVFQILCGEAVAIAVEALIAHGDDYGSGTRAQYEAMAKYNVFAPTIPFSSELISDLRRKIGERKLFDFLVVTNLLAISYCSQVTPPPDLASTIMGFLGIEFENHVVGLVESIISRAFLLNPRFRTWTTHSYLRLCGISSQVRDVLPQDIPECIFSEPDLRTLLDYAFDQLSEVKLSELSGVQASKKNADAKGGLCEQAKV